MKGLDELSIATNVVGILAFALALGASLAAFYTLTSNALNEIDTIQSEWQSAGDEISLLFKYWLSEKSRNTVELQEYLRVMQASMNALADSAISISREMEGLDILKRNSLFFGFDVRLRMKWVLRRARLMDKIAEFARRRQGLIHMQLGLLLRKDHILKFVKAELTVLQEEHCSRDGSKDTDGLIAEHHAYTRLANNL